MAIETTATIQSAPRDLYLHGAGSICRNCGQHADQHISQWTASSPFGRAYVCPVKAES